MLPANDDLFDIGPFQMLPIFAIQQLRDRFNLGREIFDRQRRQRGPFVCSLPGVSAGNIGHDDRKPGAGNVGPYKNILPDIVAPQKFQVEFFILQAEGFDFIQGELVDQNDRRIPGQSVGGQSGQHLFRMLVPATDDQMILDLHCFQPFVLHDLLLHKNGSNGGGQEGHHADAKKHQHKPDDPSADGNGEPIPVTNRSNRHHSPPNAVPDGADVGIGRRLFKITDADGAEEDDAECHDRNQNGTLPDKPR